MKTLQSFIVAATCAAVAVPMAMGAAFDSPGAGPAPTDALKSRADVRKEWSPLAQPLLKRNAAPAKSAIFANGLNPDEYGILTTICEEHFDNMTEGEVGAPFTDSRLNMPESDPRYTYPWYNMYPGYTELPNWGCHYAYEAGGTVALVSEDQAHINTPTINVGDTGMSVIQFRAYAEEGCPILWVEGAETRGMGPTWDIFPPTGYIQIEPGEWHDVSVVFRGSGPSVLYNIVLITPGTVYIDDVKVSSLDPFVGIPQDIHHTDYTGSTFTCRWDEVEGADSYLVSVYNADDQVQPLDCIIDRDATPTNEYLFDDAESGEPYFVEVYAVKGEHVSYVSDMVRIWDVEVPEMGTAVKNSEWNYTASWSSVPNAERYNYMAYSKRVPEENGVFTVTEESFQELTDHDGNRTEWTHENNESLSYDEYQVQGGVKQAGWRAKHSAPFHDYLCIDGWWYIAAHEDAGLLSPELDLSADGGRATLQLKLASEFSPAKDNEYGIDLQTQCAVAVFAWDEQKRDFSQVNLYYIKNVSLQWTDFTLQLEGLTDRCVIGIYAIDAPLNLYVWNIKLTQNRQAGESFFDPFNFTQYAEFETLEVEVPAYNSGMEIHHKVQGVTSKVYSFGWGMTQEIQTGQYSELAFACNTERTSSAAAVEAGGSRISLDADMLRISAPAGEPTEVYDLAGRCIFSGRGTCETRLPAKGSYVVRTAGVSHKIIF